MPARRLVCRPFELEPPLTLVGLSVRELSVTAVGALTVSVALSVVPYIAEIVTFCVDVTGDVAIVNDALVASAGTVTLAGTVATEVLPLASVTTVLLDGALDRVTVPCELEPSATLPGLILREDSVMAAGLTVRVAFTVAPADDAEIVAVVVVDGELVLTVNVPELCPAGIVKTVTDGTTTVLLLPMFTAWPPEPAGPVSVTVPVEDAPPGTVVGFNVNEDRGTLDAGFTVRVAVCVLVLYDAVIHLRRGQPTEATVLMNWRVGLKK